MEGGAKRPEKSYYGKKGGYHKVASARIITRNEKKESDRDSFNQWRGRETDAT